MENLIVDFNNVEETPHNDNLCEECQEFYIFNNNKCSRCIRNEYKCIKCKEYFSKDKSLKCTSCKLYDDYDVDKMTLEDVINLPNSPFKSELMTANLAELFTDYKNKKNIKHKLLVKTTEFNLLKSLCMGKNSGEVFAILDGRREFPAVIMPASFANQLLDEIVKGPDDKFRYEHAISSFVLDIWNMQNGQIISCYYKDTGDIYRCPNSITKLYELWNRLIKNELSQYNVNPKILNIV